MVMFVFSVTVFREITMRIAALNLMCSLELLGVFALINPDGILGLMDFRPSKIIFN